MAIKSGLSQKFFAHGNDLSGDVGAINNLNCSRADLKATGIDKIAVVRLPGISDGAIDYTAFFNDASLQEHAVLKPMPATVVMWSWLVGGGALAGAVGLSGSVQQMSYKGVRGRDGSMEMGVTGLAREGYPPWEDHASLTAGKVTHASAASSASVDQAAGSILGGIGFLQFFSKASGTPTFLIEHSTDNVSWATLLTFAGTGGASPFGERKTVTGTVNRYLRLTTTGTFTTAVVWVGFRRGMAGDAISLA